MLVARSQVADSKMYTLKLSVELIVVALLRKWIKWNRKSWIKKARSGSIQADVFELQGETDAFATVEKKEENVECGIESSEKER